MKREKWGGWAAFQTFVRLTVNAMPAPPPLAEEDDPFFNVRFNDGKKFGDWQIKKKLDEGGFGQVYRVFNLKTNEKGALKAESNEVEGGPAIKLEIAILRELNKDGPKPHIPVYYHAAKRGKFSYMIMTLLGDNLKHLQTVVSSPKERFSRGTWSRLGIQGLYGIKYVHDCGYVHRDIKPNNFMMGAPDDVMRSRLVHVIDFGLARAYAFKRDGKWYARKARGTAEFRGTLRYCSPNVHYRKEQGRQDDLWSLLYVLVEFNGGLPWQKERDKAKVEAMKMSMEDQAVMINMPAPMQTICPHLRTLDCYARPDYILFYNALLATMKAENITPTMRLDWEPPSAEDIIVSRLATDCLIFGLPEDPERST